MSCIKALPYQALKRRVLGAHLLLLWKAKGAVPSHCPAFRFPKIMLVLTRLKDIGPSKICRRCISFSLGGFDSLQYVTQSSQSILHFIFKRLLWCPLLCGFLVTKTLIWVVGKVSGTELNWKHFKSELPPFFRDLGWVAFGIPAFL